MGVEYINNDSFEKVIQQFQRSKREKARYELIIADLESSRKRRRRKQDMKWINNQLEDKRTKHKKAEQEFSESQTELASGFYKLSENLVRYTNFQYLDKDDEIQEGVMICFERVDCFNPEKGKAFNYMTTCVYNHFRQLYRTAKNYQELKKRYLTLLQDELDHALVQNGRVQNSRIPIDNNRGCN